MEKWDKKTAFLTNASLCDKNVIFSLTDSSSWAIQYESWFMKAAFDWSPENLIIKEEMLKVVPSRWSWFMNAA